MDTTLPEMDLKTISQISHQFTWTSSHIIRLIIFCSIIICTITGNALVLLSVSTRKNLHSPTNFLIANLALADFLVGILVLPFLATYQLTGIWYFGQGYCTAWVCIHFWLCSASILSICSICIDRYIGVSYPLMHYKYMNNNKIGIMVVIVWLLACCLSIIPVFAWPEPPSDDPLICKINQQFGHVLVASVGILYIPTIIMITLYWKIYRIAAHHFNSRRKGIMSSASTSTSNNENSEFRIHVGNSSTEDNSTSSIMEDKSSDNSTSDNSDKRTAGASPDNSLATSYKRQAKIAKKLALVVGIFIISYVPFFTMFLIRSQNINLISTEVFNIFGWIRYFNSCLNPMIYAAMIPKFRNAFKEIIFCKKR